jgi:hypothetical protein
MRHGYAGSLRGAKESGFVFDIGPVEDIACDLRDGLRRLIVANEIEKEGSALRAEGGYTRYSDLWTIR